MRITGKNLVALLPAAGTASRLGTLPISKEILPLSPAPDDPFTALPGTRVAIEDSLHLLSESGVPSAYVIIAPGKEDIPAYLGQCQKCEIDVTFLCRKSSPSVPHTLCTAIPHLADSTVVLLFPDIVFHPRNAVKRTIAEHAARSSDITLGLVPSQRGDKVDIVTVDSAGQVLEISAKPGAGITGWTWITATWSSCFTEFLGEYTLRPHQDNGELYVGDVINAAVQCGMTVGTLPIPEGVALDIGTPDDLKLFRETDFFDRR